MLIFVIVAFTAAGAAAATPTHLPPPLVKATWDGTPDKFQTALFETSWEWRDRVQEHGPIPMLVARNVIRVPRDWTYRKARPGAAHVISVTRDTSGPGLWNILTEQEVMTGDADFEFLDPANRIHMLALTLRSTTRHPTIFVRETCPDHPVQLKPIVETAHFLYLVQSCSVFGDNVIIYFAHSPDGSWGKGGCGKTVSPHELEVRYQAGQTPAPCSLVVTDSGDRRSEWGVSVDKNSQE